MRTLALGLVLVGALLVPSAFAGDPAVRWTVEDYLATWSALLTIPEGAPLPRLTDPVMAPWADDEAAVALMAQADAGDGFALADAARVAVERYEARLGDGYAPEYVETTQALLALTTARLYLEVRLWGWPVELHPGNARILAPSRASIPEVVRGLMAQAERAPSVVEPSLVLRALAPLAPTFSPLLLPEERAEFRAQARRLVRLGGDPAAAEVLRKELRRDAPTSALVARFLEMHRAETALHAAVGAGLPPPTRVAPISLAAEAGGVRYATPDGSLSAVFPFPPSASAWTASDPGEIWTAAVSLSADGPEGSRSASCKSQATPIEEPSEVLARELSGFATTRVEAAGLAGLEGERVNEGIRVLVRAVVVGDRMCRFRAIGRDAPNAAVWQRAFLDSARIQPPAAP